MASRETAQAGPAEGGRGSEGEFEEHRPLLFSLAYRMLGSIADAEDMVQEAYLRWHRTPRETVRAPRDYLCTVVTRLCIDHLRLARVRREEYVGPWLPEPLVAPLDEDPLEATILTESLSTAFLLMLERLSETERAAFLLREVFSFEYPEVARMLGRSETACRQLAKRARDRLAAGEPRFEASPREAERLAERFVELCARGDEGGLHALLTSDVVAWSDGGGKVQAARNPVHGRDNVVRLFLGIARKWPLADARLVLVGGQPGLFAHSSTGAPWVISFAVRDGRIAGVYAVANPDKLQRLPVSLERPDGPSDPPTA